MRSIEPNSLGLLFCLSRSLMSSLEACGIIRAFSRVSTKLLSSWQQRVLARCCCRHCDTVNACESRVLTAAARYCAAEVHFPEMDPLRVSCRFCTTCNVCLAAAQILFLDGVGGHLASPPKSTFCLPLSFRLQDNGVEYIELIKLVCLSQDSAEARLSLK